MMVVKKHTLTWDIICVFMPFSKTFQWESFKLPPQILVQYVKVRSIKALNRRDLSSQHVTLTTASFLKVPINTFIPAIPRLLLDGSE